jgi:hypothetical protein
VGLYDCLTAWAGTVGIGAVVPPPSAGGRFLLDRNGMEKPRPYDPDKPPADPSRYLLLNASPLNATVHEQLKVIQSGNDPKLPVLKEMKYWHAARVLQNMLLAWHIIPSRRHPRAERYDWMISTCGIGSVHHYLQGDQAGMVVEEEETEAEEESAVRIHSSVLSGTAAIHRQFRCRQTNFSATGLCLVMAPEDAKGVHVGQLMVLESERERGNGRYKLAVVRRMVQRDTTTLEVGIRFVTGDIRVGRVEVASQMRARINSPCC